MKKIILTFGILLIFNLVSYTQIGNEYSKTLKKMFEVSGSEETYKTAITEMIAMLKQQYSDTDSEIWEELEKELLKTSLNDLVEMMVPVYNKYLTKEDLEELIKFYQTPTGKKYAKHTPSIMQESMQIGQQWGMKIGQEVEKKIKEKANK